MKKLMFPREPKIKIPLPIVKKMYWLVDTITGEYLLDRNGNKILAVNMKDGRVYSAEHKGSWN